MKYKIGDKVEIIHKEGIYEIIASKQERKKTPYGTLPIDIFDYALKRIDSENPGGALIPYEYVYENMIENRI